MYLYCAFLHLCGRANKVNVHNLSINLRALFSTVVVSGSWPTAAIDPTGANECAATCLIVTAEHVYMCSHESQTNSIAHL